MIGKKRYIQLTQEARSALKHGFKSGKKAIFRQRCHFILLSDQGYDIPQIASLYEVSCQAVARWFDRYEQLGIEGLNTQKGQGEKPILRIDNHQHVETVKQLVTQHAQDLDPVLVEVEKILGKPLSKRTLQRSLGDPILKKLVTPGRHPGGNAFAE